jgi:hypothetical protein
MNKDTSSQLLDTSPLPFRRSYWVEPGVLVGGCYPGDLDAGVAREKLAGLVAVGVTRVGSLMQAEEVDAFGEPFVDYVPVLRALTLAAARNVAWERIPIRDMGVPSVATMTAILDAIDAEAARGGCTFVHCWGGKGRTGTVTGCWLMRHRCDTWATVLGHLERLTAHNRRAFPRIPQTEEQVRFVRSWPAGQ